MGLTRTQLERPTSTAAPSFADDEESCLHSQPDTQLLLSAASGPRSLGHGVLYITSKRLVWQHSSRESSSYAVEYRQLLMHAVSRGSDELPQPAIYCQLEQGEDEEDDDEEDADEAARGEEEEEVSKAAEVRFVPEDAAAVDAMYAAMCQGAALNPDPVQEGEGEGDFFFDQESLQVAPGVNVHSLLSQTAAAAGLEHAGEEYDVDDDEEDEDEEDEPYGERGERPTAGLEVIGHRVPVAAGSLSSSAAMEEAEAQPEVEDQAVIAEHRDV